MLTSILWGKQEPSYMEVYRKSPPLQVGRTNIKYCSPIESNHFLVSTVALLCSGKAGSYNLLIVFAGLLKEILVYVSVPAGYNTGRYTCTFHIGPVSFLREASVDRSNPYSKFRGRHAVFHVVF